MVASSPPMSTSRASTWRLAILALGVVYALLVVRDFSGPLIGAGDVNYYEYLGHHLLRHYRFEVPPDLGLVTTEVGYPFGTSLVYQSWCAERDLLYVVLTRLFGEGPWLQLYVASSPVIGALVIHGLARRDLGDRRAFLLACAGSFLSLYAALKYTTHVNMAAIHWAAAGMVADHLLYRRLERDEPLPLRLLLARAALLVLVIGLDLPYVAGFALTYLTVTLGCAAVLVARRRRLPVVARTGDDAFFAEPLAAGLTVTGLALGLVVYVPFAWSIVQASRVYRFEGAGGNLWASQLRMLLPILPGANPGSGWVHALFGAPEGEGEFTVGWGMLALAAFGAVSARRRGTWRTLVPVAIVFVLCLAFHPRRLPTLHLFPWFAFNRVAGRATAFLPLWLTLVGIEWRFEEWRSRAARVVSALVVLEALAAFVVVADHHRARLDDEMRRYFDAVASVPGEAVLHFPFCVAGGNGVGTKELCPYYDALSTAYAYRRFHGKSVESMYLARLHPSQVAPRLAWSRLLHPDDPDPHRARHETRCFDGDEWAAFDRLYRDHDFGGLELRVDLLPTACVLAFHERYGAPTAAATLPGPGLVELIPRTR